MVVEDNKKSNSDTVSKNGRRALLCERLGGQVTSARETAEARLATNPLIVGEVARF